MFSSKDIFFGSQATGGFTVSKSLRFRSSATAYLSRTFGTPTNNKKWTYSCWVKRGTLGTTQVIFGAGNNSNTVYGQAGFDTNNCLDWYDYNNAIIFRLTTTQVFRDPSAWYHLVFVLDTDNATSSERAKIWVNGSRVTAFSTSTYPSPGASSLVNDSAQPQSIGLVKTVTYNTYLDGYLAEVNFIDGQALDPTYFGAYDTNGIWQPKAYSGSGYGTNGFYLKFTDVGATSGSNTGYGQDFSGNGNYWTTNNFGATSNLTTYDSMLDSPTNATGDIGNYAVWSPIDNNSATISDGNLKAVLGNSGAYVARATIGPTTGKWYAEVSPTSMTNNDGIIGVVRSDSALSTIVYSQPNGWWYYANTGNKFNNAVATAYGNPYTTTDVIGIAVDLDNGAIYFGKQTGGTGSMVWQGGGDPTSGASRTGAAFTAGSSNLSLGLSLTVGVGQATSAGPETYVLNCGQRPFSATAPAGYSALNTQNLSTPTITNGASYMAAVTWTGDQTNPRSIIASSSNSGNNPLGTTFAPGLAWLKSRSNAYAHTLWDIVRGPGAAYTLSTDTTNAENNNNNATYGYLSALNSDGFTVVPGTGGSGAAPNGYAYVNQNSTTYVAWEWNAGGTPTVDNTAGAGNVPTAGSVKINGSNSGSTLAGSNPATRLSANTSAGFSIVTYTGTGANATVAHGLGVAPSMIIEKGRTGTGTIEWRIYHASLGATKFMKFDTAAAITQSNIWVDTAPTLSVFSVGTDNSVNGSTITAVAYCFAPIAGYSAFGSYTGNGASGTAGAVDGPFIYLGFRPRFIMAKRTDTTGDWWTVDTSRDAYNVSQNGLNPNLSNAESTGWYLDVLSNGFKLRIAGTGASMNASGGTYIYAAFAENPFKISRAR